MDINVVVEIQLEETRIQNQQKQERPYSFTMGYCHGYLDLLKNFEHQVENHQDTLAGWFLLKESLIPDPGGYHTRNPYTTGEVEGKIAALKWCKALAKKEGLTYA